MRTSGCAVNPNTKPKAAVWTGPREAHAVNRIKAYEDHAKGSRKAKRRKRDGKIMESTRLTIAPLAIPLPLDLADASASISLF
jgi:hypothetical protein